MVLEFFLLFPLGLTFLHDIPATLQKTLRNYFFVTHHVSMSLFARGFLFCLGTNAKREFRVTVLCN